MCARACPLTEPQPKLLTARTGRSSSTMQTAFILPLVLLLIGCPVTGADNVKANPLSGVIQMLNDLKAKVTKDGEDEAKAYDEYYDWCNKVTGEELHSIELDKERKEKLVADIEKYFAEIEQSGKAISDEAKAIAQAIKEGKNALHLREKQHSDFMAAEKELVESIDMLSRAITVLESEMKKGSAAAFTQMLDTKMPVILQVLNTVLDAASFTTSDKDKLVALVQAQQEDDSLAAPAAAVYTSKSGSIVDMLNEMKDKAETKLEELRQGEQQARYVYNQLVAALKAQKAADEKDLASEKEEKNEAGEDKADAEKDLSGTVKVLDVHTEAYRQTKAQCMQTSSDHEQTVKSRTEELKVVGEAISILDTMSSKAAGRTYTLLQLSSGLSALKTQDDLAALEVITLIKKMAKSHHSAALAQLGSKIGSVAQTGGSAQDVFAKIKGMISDMIAKLEKEQQDEASEKAYCDEQLSDATQKEGDMMDGIKTIASKKDQKAGKSQTAKEDEKSLLADIAKIDEAQTELDKIRKDEHAAFMEAKTDLELGIKGVRKATQLLKDYYSEDTEKEDDTAFAQMSQPAVPQKHSKSGSAIDGILDILEMTESDFATNLAKIQTEEADSLAEYEKTAAENEVEKTALTQQVKFKVQEYKTLDTQITQHDSDLDAAKTEHSAVTDFLVELKKRCKAKPSSYEIRQQKRQAEITGLKEAMEILKNEVAFAQRRKFSNHLRGGALA